MNRLTNAKGEGANVKGQWTCRSWTVVLRATVVLLCLAAPVVAAGQASQPVEVPVVDGAAGPCKADFTVTDASDKPLYGAHIRVQIRFGFMSQRKTDLDVGTNSDGKARVTGLPNKVKKPLEYTVKYKDQAKSVMSDPGVDCNADQKVQFGSQ